MISSTMQRVSLPLLLLLTLASQGYSGPCKQRKFDQESVVCVCDQTYCDTLDEIVPLKTGQAQVFESGKDGRRFYKETLQFGPTTRPLPNKGENVQTFLPIANVTITVNAGKQYQEIFGFGGAFTDAAGINIVSLPQKLQDSIIRDYYSNQGIEYNIGRVPMASCDFSTRAYSYDDVPNDFQLEHFALAQEDHKYKIPFIQKANSVSPKGILYFGSPWSPPYWMKSNNKVINGGVLKGDVGGQYYETWANYFVKFLQSYASSNISFWGLTVENEPSAGFDPKYSWQCLGFTPETQRDFVKLNLGPVLEKAGYGPDKIKLMILDDQRLFLPKFVDKVLEDPIVNKYVSGVAFHWYLNDVAPPKLLDIVHDKHPNKFLLATEACYGDRPWDYPKAALGSWHRAEAYALDIIQDLNHWTTGWVDWNLALNMQGGPNWVGNYVDAPIIVNADAQEYYKQPMFYALGHFSKFIERGSVRVETTVESTDFIELLNVAFKRPDGAYVVVVLNRNKFEVNLRIADTRQGDVINVIPANSIQTYIWWYNKKP